MKTEEARERAKSFSTVHLPFVFVVQETVVLPVHTPETTREGGWKVVDFDRRASAPALRVDRRSIGQVADVRARLGRSRSIGPVNRSMANEPPEPSPSPAGKIRIV